ASAATANRVYEHSTTGRYPEKMTYAKMSFFSWIRKFPHGTCRNQDQPHIPKEKSYFGPMKKITDNLLFRVIVAIVLGIILGNVLPESIGRIVATFNGLFDQLLKFLIPLIILGLIMPALAKLGNTAGKLLLLTVVIAYGSTLFAGFSSYLASISIFPSLLSGQEAAAVDDGAIALTPYFSIEIPPMLDVMSALVLAFLVGIGLAQLNKSTLADAAED